MDRRYPLWRPSESRVLDRPPGWIFNTLVLAFGLYTVWCASVPGWQLLVSLPLALGLVIGLAWGVRLTIYNFRHVRRDKELVKGSRLLWSVAPLIGFLALGIASLGLPLRLRFRWSREAFDRAVEEVRRSHDLIPGESQAQHAPTRIGLFDVDYCEALPDGARFLVEDAGGFFGFGGFAYSPSGQLPSPTREDWYSNLEGDWYVWIRGF